MNSQVIAGLERVLDGLRLICVGLMLQPVAAAAAVLGVVGFDLPLWTAALIGTALTILRIVGLGRCLSVPKACRARGLVTAAMVLEVAVVIGALLIVWMGVTDPLTQPGLWLLLLIDWTKTALFLLFVSSLAHYTETQGLAGTGSRWQEKWMNTAICLVALVILSFVGCVSPLLYVGLLTAGVGLIFWWMQIDLLRFVRFFIQRKVQVVYYAAGKRPPRVLRDIEYLE